MKKYVTLILAFVILISNAFTKVVKFPRFNHEVVTTEDVETLVYEIVPSDVVDAFMYATSNEDTDYQNDIRMYLLAIGKKESEWKYTRSLRANANGTYDIGYLMLNEDNLDDPIFQKHFMPKKGEFPISDPQEFLMITCINFYKYLYNRYGCDASYAYNAGERRFIEGRIPEASYKYKSDILDNLNLYIEDLTNIIINRKAYEAKQEKIAKERTIKKLMVNPINHISINKMHFLNLKSNNLVKRVFYRINVFIAKDPAEEINKKLSRKTIIIIFDDDDTILRKSLFTFNGKTSEIDEVLVKSKKYNVYI